MISYTPGLLILRSEGRVLEGTALRYGDLARISTHSHERIVPGAFGDLSATDIIFNMMHAREKPLARSGFGLQLEDSAAELVIRAEMPATRDGDEALELVRRGVLRGLSVEYIGVRDRYDGELRVVEEATLMGVALVDRPAFKQSQVTSTRHEDEKTRSNRKWWF